MDRNSYIEYLLQQQLQDRVENADSSFGKIKQLTADVNALGNNLVKGGEFFKGLNNTGMQNLGARVSNYGNNISSAAGKFGDIINAPANYFKGFANRTINQGLNKAGNYLASKTGLAGKVGTALTNLGTTAAGAGSALGSSLLNATGTATAGGSALGSALAAETGGAAAGAGSALGNALASNTAAGAGAAAGGSAASGAAAAGPIAALAVMALAGANRKRAKKSSESLLRSTNDMVEQGADNALAQTQQNSEILQQGAQQGLSGGIVTGGAAPTQTQQYNPIAEYQDYLRQNGYADEVVNGVQQGLNSGNRDIADWITQYNQGAAGQQNPINIPQTQEEIAAARAGSFNTPVQLGGVNKTQSVKDSLLNKLANGLGDFAKGYQENKTTAFAPENLQANNSKGKMTRAGEALGTIARISQNPTVQGLIAGGLSTVLTGNPLYGLGQGYKFANNRQMSNIYQKALQDQGINLDTGMFGNVGSSDFNALMTPQYKQWGNDLRKTYYDSLADYRAGMLKNAERKAEIDANYKKEKLAIDKKNAESNAIRARKTGSSRGTAKTPKPQDNPDWANDLSDFSRIITDPRFIDKSDEAKARFIKKYGVDPMKYIKL